MRAVLALMILISTKSFAQLDSTASPLAFSAYLETYYTFDFGQPNNHTRPAFVYSHNRHNELNLNLGYVKGAYNKDGVRANFALGTGTYMHANYAAEPDGLKHVYEANVGVKISRKKNLWIDAGVFPSHIGVESAVGKDNWTLTRSMSADNSPYFETGAKISYTTPDGKWFISGLLLNGWQRIQRVDGNNTPALGHQLMYKPNARITLNSSSFVGNDNPDSTRQMRYFHNLYGIFQITDKFALTAGFDLGAAQKNKGSKIYHTWYSPMLILKFIPSEEQSFALRTEYYSDQNGTIISTATPNGFKTFGYSLNYDLQIRKNVVWRVEARRLTSKDKVFTWANKPSNNNFFITTSLAIAIP